MSQYSQQHQVKQLLGFVTNEHGCPWMVLATGDTKVWLFCQGYPKGVVGNRNCFIATGLQNPVAKNRLVDVVRQALDGGMNVDMRCSPPLIYTERFTLGHVEVRKIADVDAEIIESNRRRPETPLTLERL